MTVSPAGPAGDDPDGHVLASDAEREATVERLRVAVADGRLTMDELSDRSEIAYRARTGAELIALTRDLPRSSTPVVGSSVVVPGNGEPVDSYVAIFSASGRNGRWRVPRRSRAVSVFGTVDLDMRSAELAGHDVHVRAVSVFGSIEITVPEGVEVQLTGLALFGSKSARVPPTAPGAPVLHVTCTAVFGSVDVKASKDERALDRPAQ